jgi:hypothetical protein
MIVDKGQMGEKKRQYTTGQIVVRHGTVRMADEIYDRLSVVTGDAQTQGESTPRGGRDKLSPHSSKGGWRWRRATWFNWTDTSFGMGRSGWNSRGEIS